MMKPDICESKSFSIIGVSRSGTTLLQFLLDAHSHIAVCPESDIFRNLERAGLEANMCDNIRMYQVLKQSADSLSNYNESEFHLIKDMMEKRYLNKTTIEVLDDLVKRYLKNEKATIIGEKTPRHLYCIDSIVRLIPNHRFVVMERNYLDNIHSLHKSFIRFSGKKNTIFNLLYYSAYEVKLGKNRIFNLKRKALENAIYITYEDLVLNTESTLNNVCKFLGVRLEESMLNTTERVTDFRNERLNILHENISKSINGLSIGRGDKLFSYKESHLINVFMNPSFVKLIDLFFKKKIKTTDKLIFVYCLLFSLFSTITFREKYIRYKYLFKRKFYNPNV